MIFGISLFFGTITAIFAYYKWNQRYTMISTGGITGRANAHITNLLVLWVVCTIAYNVIFSLLGDLATWLLDHWYIVVGVIVVLGILVKLGSDSLSKEDAEKIRENIRNNSERFFEVGEDTFLDCKHVSVVVNDANDYACDTMIHVFDANDKDDASDVVIYLMRLDFDYAQKTIFSQLLAKKEDVNSKYDPMTMDFIPTDKELLEKDMKEVAEDSKLYDGAIRLYYQTTGKQWGSPENRSTDEMSYQDNENGDTIDSNDNASDYVNPQKTDVQDNTIPGDNVTHPKFCQYCGGKINGNGKFCPHCGKPIPIQK